MTDEVPRVLLRGEETGGQVAVVELTGKGRPPLHRHDFDETFYVLEGELTLIMDVGETVVRAGDIVVQRGTNHGWANRSGRHCRIAFVLIDGEYHLE